MADLTITAANVIPVVPTTRTGGNAPFIPPENGVALVDVTPFQPLYYDATGPGYRPAAAISATAAAATCVSLVSSKAGQAVVVMSDGGVGLGAILTAAEEYVVSHNSGRVAPKGDLVTGDYYTRLGYASDDHTFVLDFNATGVVV